MVLHAVAAVSVWRSVSMQYFHLTIYQLWVSLQKGGWLCFVKTENNVTKSFFLHVQPRETGYIALNDGRRLCLECLDSAIMDTSECQPLYTDIQKFYEGLDMKLDQQVPLLLVERQALNEARDGEKNVRQNSFLPGSSKCNTWEYYNDIQLLDILGTSVWCQALSSQLTIWKMTHFSCYSHSC